MHSILILNMLFTIFNTANCNSTLWQPSNGQSREEWMKMNGMPPAEYQKAKAKQEELMNILNTRSNISTKPNLMRSSETSTSKNSQSGNCQVWLTELQLNQIITQLKNDEAIASQNKTTTWSTNEAKTTPTTISRLSGERKRKRRTLTDFARNAIAKWSLPIVYKFDGTHTSFEQGEIRKAIKLVSASTCIRFREIAMYEVYNTNHLLFAKNYSGNACSSYIGKMNWYPQKINLDSGCIQIGVILHEIGHALGAIHEHQRIDRDSTIHILDQNIAPDWRIWLLKDPSGDLNSSPFDVNSVMHYLPRSSISINGNNVIETNDPLYQLNLGQRSGLSYFDVKMLNRAYCSASCTRSTIPNCLRGGYQNPNNCSSCICPDGFAGKFCEILAPSKNGNCGGIINLDTTENYYMELKSPGYDNPGFYASNQECTWQIKAQPGLKIIFRLFSQFGIYAEYDSCRHWVEIKHRSNFTLTGARFCGGTLPSSAVVSEANEMIIVFKSNYLSNTYNYQSWRGFTASVSIRFINEVIWRCYSNDMLLDLRICGMRQGSNDIFDWIVVPGYLFFIDSGYPRKANDFAELILPKKKKVPTATLR